MKKTTLFPGVLVAILLVSSCEKDLEKSPLAPDGAKGTMVTKSGTLSPGQIHNNLVTEYIGTYGLQADKQITLDEARAHYLAMIQIADNQGLGNTVLTGNQEADALLAYHVNAGFFNNGVLPAPEELVALAIQQVQNASIRNAYAQIAGSACQGGNNNWVSDSQHILAGLSGLSAKEREQTDGFGSVLGGSYQLWNGQLSLEQCRQNFISVCDAIGYQVGADAEFVYHSNKAEEYSHYGMTYHPMNLHWAEIASAMWSLQAAWSFK